MNPTGRKPSAQQKQQRSRSVPQKAAEKSPTENSPQESEKQAPPSSPTEASKPKRKGACSLDPRSRECEDQRDSSERKSASAGEPELHGDEPDSRSTPCSSEQVKCEEGQDPHS